MRTYDFSNTRCFIDFDSTIANSLPKYNIVLDELVKGKLTDKHYIEYYQDFGDAYDIIPGSPWKAILRDLVEYHTTHMAQEAGVKKGSSEWDALYFSNFAYVARDIEPGCPIGGEYGAELEEALTNDIVLRFEEGCARLFPKLGYDELAIKPAVKFCKLYTQMGGHLIIHSGTNEAILKSMLSVIGIEDLFEDYLCSNMMVDADPSKLGKWGYKTELLNRLLDKYPINGMRDAVVGDTKGDAYGAYEVGLPFLLVWRGYPKDPTRLSGAEDDYLTPNAIVSMVQEDLETKPEDSFDGEVGKMLEFMEQVSHGQATAPEHHMTGI